jgi:hypothetical protein
MVCIVLSVGEPVVESVVVLTEEVRVLDTVMVVVVVVVEVVVRVVELLVVVRVSVGGRRMRPAADVDVGGPMEVIVLLVDVIVLLVEVDVEDLVVLEVDVVMTPPTRCPPSNCPTCIDEVTVT